MITVTPSVGFGTASTVRTIEVTVIPEVIKTTGIQFTNIEEGVYETDKLQLKYDILPADHTYSYLTWASSNENIATVDKNGVVTGIKAGDVTIYACWIGFPISWNNLSTFSNPVGAAFLQ